MSRTIELLSEDAMPAGGDFHLVLTDDMRYESTYAECQKLSNALVERLNEFVADVIRRDDEDGEEADVSGQVRRIANLLVKESIQDLSGG